MSLSVIVVDVLVVGDGCDVYSPHPLWLVDTFVHSAKIRKDQPILKIFSVSYSQSVWKYRCQISSWKMEMHPVWKRPRRVTLIIFNMNKSSDARWASRRSCRMERAANNSSAQKTLDRQNSVSRLTTAVVKLRQSCARTELFNPSRWCKTCAQRLLCWWCFAEFSPLVGSCSGCDAEHFLWVKKKKKKKGKS